MTGQRAVIPVNARAAWNKGLPANDTREAAWQLGTLAGRLCELSGSGASAVLTAAFRLVLDAQREREPVAWVTDTASNFYPPDAAANGVDLHSLVVVRVPTKADLARAAEHLLRSGAFGLVVIDMPGNIDRAGNNTVTAPMQSRLLGLAQKHSSAVVFLTEKSPRAASIGSLISLRAEATIQEVSGGDMTYVVHVLKDKRRSPGWTYSEVCRGPAGMR